MIAHVSSGSTGCHYLYTHHPTRSIQAACAPSQSQQEPNDASDLEQVSENEEAPGSDDDDDDDDEDAGSDSVEEDQDQPPIEDSQGPSDEPTCDAVDSFDYAGAWDDAPDESPSDNNGELVGEVGDVPLSQPSPDEGELHDHDVVTIEESPMKSVEDMQAQRGGDWSQNQWTVCPAVHLLVRWLQHGL